jgi:hypothetical protein
VALPDDIESGNFSKEVGIVTLPLNVSWSGPTRTWNLNDKRQRRRVYEKVLTEGTEDDVRRFVDINQLIDEWDELWLPPHVRQAWSTHLRRLRGIQLAC